MSQDTRLAPYRAKRNTFTYFLQSFIQLKISLCEAVGSIWKTAAPESLVMKEHTLFSVPVTPKRMQRCRNQQAEAVMVCFYMVVRSTWMDSVNETCTLTARAVPQSALHFI